MQSKYKRDDMYRYRFISKHPGFQNNWYLCSYCGKIISKRNMQVDHVVAINKTRKWWNLSSMPYRMLVKHYTHGVNSVENLVPACAQCNEKKGGKAGRWVLKGFVGQTYYKVVWMALILFFLAFFVMHVIIRPLSPVEVYDAFKFVFLRFRDIVRSLLAHIMLFITRLNLE